ncbi:MAG TPA: polysaccharide deacetylase family protein [Candidatus Eisenbacteria bacterium]|nr:polysaccharide deacetylase family protein [Candidatus Eisenbacteria bacterium]
MLHLPSPWRVPEIIIRRRKVLATRFSVNEPIAALTFDDGPDPASTPLVLDLLKTYRVRATFFMLGKSAQRYPDLLKRVAAEGHVVGNHSWNHTSFATMAGRERRAQLRRCQEALSPYGRRIFRPPWGKHTTASLWDAYCLRYRVILWDVDVDDWCDRDSDRMAGRLLDETRPGSIILLHDAVFNNTGNGKGPAPCLDRTPMLLALEMFLEQAPARFRFVTIPEMFDLGRPMND